MSESKPWTIPAINQRLAEISDEIDRISEIDHPADGHVERVDRLVAFGEKLQQERKRLEAVNQRRAEEAKSKAQAALDANTEAVET